METTNYITPTKKDPVFTATCDSFGYIERRLYKDALAGNTCFPVFDISYHQAILALHEWLIENKEYVLDDPKAKYFIYAVNGSLNKWGDYNRKVVYSISGSKAKQYLF